VVVACALCKLLQLGDLILGLERLRTKSCTLAVTRLQRQLNGAELSTQTTDFDCVEIVVGGASRCGATGVGACRELCVGVVELLLDHIELIHFLAHSHQRRLGDARALGRLARQLGVVVGLQQLALELLRVLDLSLGGTELGLALLELGAQLRNLLLGGGGGGGGGGCGSTSGGGALRAAASASAVVRAWRSASRTRSSRSATTASSWRFSPIAESSATCSES
jgi:hypothetical protein